MVAVNYRLEARMALKRAEKRLWEIENELTKSSPEAYTHKYYARKLMNALELLEKGDDILH